MTISLSGKNYLGYDLSQIGGSSQPILAEREHLQLEFRTRAASGLLFYTGRSEAEARVREYHPGFTPSAPGLNSKRRIEFFHSDQRFSRILIQNLFILRKNEIYKMEV